MSKKLIAILLIFIIVISVLIFIKFIYLNNFPIQSLSRIKPVPAPTLETSLSLLPSSQVVSASPNLPAGLLRAKASATERRQGAQVNVVLNSNLPSNSPKLIQFEINYDPAALYSVNVTPGDYLINPEVILNN